MKNKLHKLLADNKNVHFKSIDIEAALNISGVNVRKIVGLLRDESVPIASGNKGYSFATTAEELEPTWLHLEHRAMKQLARAHKLRKIFNREMQYKFDFEEHF